MFKGILFFGLFVIFLTSSVKASNIADSIQARIEQERESFAKLQLYLRLYEHLLKSDSLNAKTVLDSAYTFSTMLEDRASALKNLSVLGRYHWTIGNLEASLRIFNEAENLTHFVQDNTLTADLYSNIGLAHYSKGDYSESINYHWRSIQKYGLQEDTSGIAKGYNNLGIVYLKMEELDKALEYHEISLNLCKKINFAPGIAHNLGNLGIIYRRQNKYDEAIKAYSQSLEIHRASGNKYHEAINLNNIGNLLEFKEDYKGALDYYGRSLTLRKEVNDEPGIASCLHNIASVQFKLRNYKEAENIFFKSLEFSEKVRSKDLIKNVHHGLSALYEAKGDYQKALIHERKYTIWKDSIINENNYQLIKNLEFKHETANKEKEILSLNNKDIENQLQLSKQKNIIYIAGLLLALSISVFVIVLVVMRHKTLMNEKLSAKEKELDKLKLNFFTGITHEFRTPLTLILDPVSKLLNEEKSDKQKEAYELIRSNSNKLLGLVNELLALSKIEAGKLPVDYQKIKLNDFVKPIVVVYKSIAKSRNINFRADYPEEGPEVCLDAAKIEKVITNILDNSLKFTDPGGKILMDVKVRENASANKSVVFTIEDNGPGIPENEQKRIFEKFYSGPSANRRLQQGFGIGLALSKELVELHKGTITVESEEGIGTTFVVSLPVEQPEMKGYQILDPEPELPVLVEENELTPKEKGLILVVEDSADLLKYIQDEFAPFFDVKLSKNGADGLEKAKKYVPDLVISDIVMPTMDGFQLCEAIKADELIGHVPVILLTGKAEAADRMAGYEKGADDYIPKPFEMKELLVRVKNIILQRKKLQEKYAQDIKHGDHSNLPSRESQFLKKLDEAIEKNISNSDFDVDELTKEIGVSRMQIHRKLKTLTNFSTTEYIRNYRLKKALKLLKNKSLSISEIAYEVGFSKHAYFSESFKKLYHQTPLEYQKSQPDQNQQLLET